MTEVRYAAIEISFSTGDKKFDGVLVHMALVMNNPNPYE